MTLKELQPQLLSLTPEEKSQAFNVKAQAKPTSSKTIPPYPQLT
jgi:hypothetical protein